MLLGGCFERYHLGYVLPEATPDGTEPDVYYALFRIAAACAENGFLEELAAEIDGLSGFERQSVGGREVWRDPGNVVLLRDDILIHLSAPRGSTLESVEPVVEAFVASPPE
jgi:hypothetical protein